MAVNSVRLVTDAPPPFESIVFPGIPDYMRNPQVFEIFKHRIRIWRTEVVPLTREDPGRVSGLLEVVPVNNGGEPTGLRWRYSAHVQPSWAEHFLYVLHGNYPGDQPAVDEREVYRLTSLEIHWALRNLSAFRQRMEEFSLKKLEREERH